MNEAKPAISSLNRPLPGRFFLFADAFFSQAAPQVGQAAVDEVLRLLRRPAEELADLRYAVALEAQGDGVAPGWHQPPEAIADGPSRFAPGRGALGVRGRRRGIERGVLLLLASALQRDLLAPAQPPDLVDHGAIGGAAQVDGVELGGSVLLALNLHHPHQGHLNQVVGPVRHPARTDAVHGSHQVAMELCVVRRAVCGLGWGIRDHRAAPPERRIAYYDGRRE